MTFRRGASLDIASTLGYSDAADVGPTAGNGFRTRWPDDLAALQEAGLTDIRITLDWARLQPKPGELDADWSEWFSQVLHAADAIGVRAWACLHDGSIPRWFDNDGGFSDTDTFTSWWPRWVERAADRFGDVVGGWIPFATIVGDAPAQPWIDTWGILRSGGAPVVAAVDLRRHAHTVDRYVGQMDLLGAVIGGDWADDDVVDERTLERVADRWGGELREAADAADSALILPGFVAGHRDADTAGAIVGAMRSVLDDACADGVPIEAAFVEPGIAGAETAAGLLDPDRGTTPSIANFTAK
jgi:beta-glucosidase